MENPASVPFLGIGDFKFVVTIHTISYSNPGERYCILCIDREQAKAAVVEWENKNFLKNYTHEILPITGVRW